MLRDLTVGMYLPGNSRLHSLHPGAKIIATAILMLAVFLVTSMSGCLVLAAVLFGLWGLAGLSPRLLVQGFRPLLWVLLLVLPLQLFFTPGPPLAVWGPLAISSTGVEGSLWLLYRLAALVAISSLLTLTTSPVALADGLEQLLAPLAKVRFPAHEMAMVISIALRFIPLLGEEADIIGKAQKSRGAALDSGNLGQRSKAAVAFLVPMILASFRRADELALAMESRCYRGGAGRTRLRRTRIGAAEILAVLGAAAVALIAGGRW